MLHEPFTRALVRRPAQNVADGLTTQALGAPDFDLTVEQYGRYLDALRECGLQVTVLPPDLRYPDGHFVEDAAVIFEDMAFICRPGAPARAGEIVEVSQNLKHLQRVFVRGETATIDGGDVLFCADRILIGLSARTNREGAEQLRAALLTYRTTLPVELVRFEGVLHLKSGLTELAPGVLVQSALLQTDHDLGFAEVVTLPAEEAYAANLLPLGDTLLLARGPYPTIQDAARRHYDRIIELDMTEFEKMDGGLSCLSLRY